MLVNAVLFDPSLAYFEPETTDHGNHGHPNPSQSHNCENHARMKIQDIRPMIEKSMQ